VRTLIALRCNAPENEVTISLILGIPAFPDGVNVAWKGRTSVSTYLVERYWPGVINELLLEALRRGRRVIAETSGDRKAVPWPWAIGIVELPSPV
jgi:hypothetical protein